MPWLWLALLTGCKNDPERSPAEPVDLLPYADPFIGSGGNGFNVGSHPPGAALPWGLAWPSPDTSDSGGSTLSAYHCGGYHYEDDHIEAFSHMHLQGVGVPSYGLIGYMPTDGWDATKTDPHGFRAPFSHDSEQASPGYYEVTLADSGIRVQLAATERTALQRYTFPADTDPTVIIDLEHSLEGGRTFAAGLEILPDAARVEGWMENDGSIGHEQQVFFVAEFDSVPTAWGAWQEGSVEEGGTAATQEEETGVDVGAWLTFDADVVTVRTALSTVDLDGAQANFDAEHSGFDVDTDVAAAHQEWTRWMDHVRVWGGSEEDREKFASALYRVILMPTLYSDVDGRYTGFDREIHVADGYRYHTDLSLWDTYRSPHPLYTLLWPDTHRDLLWSLARMAEQGGNLPRWPHGLSDSGSMLGSSAHIVIAEAWQKGLRDFDEELLWEVAYAEAMGTIPTLYGARPDVTSYDQYGYYPADLFGSSVAWTQEVCISDHALSRMALDFGTEADVAFLAYRSHFWRNVWNPECGFMHARASDGSFDDCPVETQWLEEYTEGNARQYLWLVPHDPEGLFEVLGGNDAALVRLEQMFDEAAVDLDIQIPGNWYWHGNEPGQHTAWLFALAGRPDLTRQWVHWIMDTHYGTENNGIAGNDDGGTLSAWFIFAAMGFYPLAGTDRYVIGDPVFSRIEFEVEGGTFTVLRLGDGEVSEVWLNGALWERPDFQHHHLVPGGSLVFMAE